MIAGQGENPLQLLFRNRTYFTPSTIFWRMVVQHATASTASEEQLQSNGKTERALVLKKQSAT